MNSLSPKESLGILLNSFDDIEGLYYQELKKRLLSPEGLRIKIKDFSYEWIETHDVDSKRFRFEFPIRAELNKLVTFSDETFEIWYPHGKLLIHKNLINSLCNHPILGSSHNKHIFINLRLILHHERLTSEVKVFINSPTSYLEYLKSIYSYKEINHNELVLIRESFVAQEMGLMIKEHSKYLNKINRQYSLLKHKGYILGL